MNISNLHDYQLRATRHIMLHHHCILAIDMGLGKTAATLAAIEMLTPRRVLIVAPKRVAETVWQQEAAKWQCSFAKAIMVAKGTKVQRLAALKSDFVICSRDNITDIINEEVNPFDIIVLDELTSFKNISASRTKAVMQLTAKADRVIGLTGTLLANGAIDLYAQAVVVGLQNRWPAANFYAWRATYFIDMLAHTRLQFSKWKLRGNLADVLQPIADDVFTLSAADYLQIQPVTYVMHEVELSTAAKREYMRLSAMLALNIGGEVLSFNEQQRFAKLQTLCNGFVYEGFGDDRRVVRATRSEKMEEVAEFCARAAGEGEAVLLFFAYVEERKWLRELLQAKGLRVKVVGVDCDALTKWEEHEVDVMMAHPASAGHGLNLQAGGRLIVWSSMTYNYEYWAQGNARLARQGQRKAVQVHVFAAADTCESAIYQAIKAKEQTQNNFKALTKQ